MNARELIAALKSLAQNRQHMLLVGDRGSGRTMIARRMVKLMGPLNPVEYSEVHAVYTEAGLRVVRGDGTWPKLDRPFRAPHHTISTGGITGRVVQATKLAPSARTDGLRIFHGEVVLAHRGVLFLDETLDFQRQALDIVSLMLHQGEAQYWYRGEHLRTQPVRPLVICTLDVGWENIFARRVPDKLHCKLHPVQLEREVALQACEILDKELKCISET